MSAVSRCGGKKFNGFAHVGDQAPKGLQGVPAVLFGLAAGFLPVGERKAFASSIGVPEEELAAMAFRELVQRNDLITGADLKALKPTFTSTAPIKLAILDEIANEQLADIVKRFPNIVEINIPWLQGLNDDSFAHLAELSGLQILTCGSLDECEVTDAGFAQLTKLSQLRQLAFNTYEQLSDETIAHIAKLSRLQMLDIADTSLTDGQLAYLVAHLPQLEILSLERSYRITDNSLPALARLPHLRELSLMGCYRVTDSGLVALAQANPPNLQTLYLDKSEAATHLSAFTATRITDRGCAYLTSRLPHLILASRNCLGEII